MPAHQATLHISTRGHCHVLDITEAVARVVTESGFREGVANVAGIGSTLGITTIECEPGCLADLEQAMEEIAPSNADYAHNARWGDRNGFAHLRSALLGTARSFPVTAGRLALGTWQQIVLCDFDDRPRKRQVVVTVVG